LVLVEVETEFIAIGSGGDLAMGAMGAGATARQAVEIAARFDCFTGGKIDEFRLSTLKQPKKRISFPPDGEAAFS
jgi:ATP-dependent protease HslVU (ClpYQ) peptidase subunit